MPGISMLVPHCQQSSPGACLPACVRMVLSALGNECSEAQVATLLGSYEFGTPASRIERLNEWGYQVQYGRFSFEQLEDALAYGRFLIVFVRADVLPWADFGGFHALVLVRVTPDFVFVNDPVLDDGPSRLPTDYFLLAWEEFDCLAAVIYR